MYANQEEEWNSLGKSAITLHGVLGLWMLYWLFTAKDHVTVGGKKRV